MQKTQLQPLLESLRLDGVGNSILPGRGGKYVKIQQGNKTALVGTTPALLHPIGIIEEKAGVPHIGVSERELLINLPGLHKKIVGAMK